MTIHTQAPWRWVWSENTKRIAIQGGSPKFDLTVVDFVRYGMGGAAPRFREDVDRMNIMHRADHWGVVVPGREHHASWFKTLDHPDANLIIAAPELLAALELIANRADIKADDNPGRECAHILATACIAIAKAKARGQT